MYSRLEECTFKLIQCNLFSGEDLTGKKKKKRDGGEDEQTEDDYALDLLEDIKIPPNTPQRATLVSSYTKEYSRILRNRPIY